MLRGHAEEAQVDQAIARVLRAERDAQQAITHCQAECRELVAAAHRRAEAISAQAERRIATLREKIGVAIEQRIGELENTAGPGPLAQAEDDPLHERLRRAAAAVADELTEAAP